VQVETDPSDRDVDSDCVVDAQSRRTIGRPSRLRPELIDDLCELIGGGASPEQAAAALGIGLSTYYDWQKRGRDFERTIAHSEHDELCRDLCRRVALARLEMEQELVASLRAQALPHPRRRTVNKSVPLVDGHGVVHDDDGNPVVLATVTITEEPASVDVRAADVLLRRCERARERDITRNEFLEENVSPFVATEMEERLSRSLKESLPRLRAQLLAGEDDCDTDPGPNAQQQTPIAHTPRRESDDMCGPYAWEAQVQILPIRGEAH